MTALGFPLPMTREEYRVARLGELERLPTSSISEADLLAGYARAVETVECRCACGGLLRSLNTSRAIAYAVEAHGATPQHEGWRCEQ